MNKQEILIKKRDAIEARPAARARAADLKDPRALVFQAEAMRLGFILSEDLLSTISRLSDTAIMALYKEVVPVLRNMVGDDVEWKPMYPNFPKQVMEAPVIELFLNAIVHYWSGGQWTPDYVAEPRLPAFEATKFRTLSLAGSDDLASIFTEILSANASVTPADIRMLTEMFDRGDINEAQLAAALPDNIPFRETLCWFVGECIDRGWTVTGMGALKTATDVLRVATHLSQGDVSLAENTRYRSFSRPLRRAFVERLEQVANQNDVFRHRGKWVRLAHSLHVGDFSAQAPNFYNMITAARSNATKYQSFDGRVESAIANRDRKGVCSLLKQRPGVFARRLDHLLREFGPRDIAREFIGVVDKVDTRVLLQLHGHFNGRTQSVDRRLVFPKGNMGKARLLTNTLEALPTATVKHIRDGIESALEARFATLDPLGKVYIDKTLWDCPIPLSLRSASEGLQTVARGTRMPIGDKGTVRMFIYWKGRDIDLSGFLVNEDFTQESTVAYYNLREGFGCHSGDITNAPRGASEFIDINVDQALAEGHRYLVMTVHVYSGPTFKEHEVCYAGWMTRSHPGSNEIYDPKTVQHRIDVQADSRTAVPVMFDLKERQAIWLDLVQRGGNLRRPNNVANSKAGLVDFIDGALNMDNKPTLFELFEMHARARGTIVDNMNDADKVFSWSEGTKPTDVSEILSEYLG